MKNQTTVIEDLDHFRDMIRILAAGLNMGGTDSATTTAGTALSGAR